MTPGPADPPPTRVRYLVLGLLTSMGVLLYLDRVCISTAILYITKDLDLSAADGDLVQSAFFWAYGLGQVPAGWLGDRLGARRMLVCYVLLWSAFTALTGLAGGLVTLVVARLLFGLAEAGAYPIAGRVNGLWMPFTRRALSSSVITLGGRAGGTIAPALTAYLVLSLGGWRPVFWLYGLLGGVWAVGFWYAFRERPAEHPWCNQAERDLIEGPAPGAGAAPDGSRFPWRLALGSVTLWVNSGMQFLLNLAWAFLITKTQPFLIETHQLTEEVASYLASLPLFASMFGGLLGGALVDRLTRRLGLTWGRRLPGMLPRFVAAAALVAAALAPGPYSATAALVLAGFFVDLGLPAIWAYFQDAGRPYVGTFLAWGNMFGNFGAAVSPLLLGYLAREYGWLAALGTGAGVMGVSALCWLGIDARVPLLPVERRSDGTGAGAASR